MKHSEKILACGEHLSLPPAIGRVFLCALLLVSLLFLFYYGDRILLVLIWGITGVLFLWLHRLSAKIPLTITNCRLYGYALWGRKVDLPLSSISGCSLASCHSLKVYTLERTYCFPLLKNPYTLYNVLITLTYKA